MMKTKALTIGTLVAILVIFFSATFYLIGKHQGHVQVELLNKGTFTKTLSAIEKIRSGGTPAALTLLENHCYASAVSILSQEKRYHETAMQELFADLRRYRSQYATNSAEWTAIERDLEVRLSRELGQQ
jgi:hypothetical protein